MEIKTVKELWEDHANYFEDGQYTRCRFNETNANEQWISAKSLIQELQPCVNALEKDHYRGTLTRLRVIIELIKEKVKQ